MKKGLLRDHVLLGDGALDPFSVSTHALGQLRKIKGENVLTAVDILHYWKVLISLSSNVIDDKLCLTGSTLSFIPF